MKNMPQRASIYRKKTVIQDGNIITSKAAGTTFDFAYQIVTYLLGKDAAKRLAKEIYS